MTENGEKKKTRETKNSIDESPFLSIFMWEFLRQNRYKVFMFHKVFKSKCLVSNFAIIINKPVKYFLDHASILSFLNRYISFFGVEDEIHFSSRDKNTISRKCQIFRKQFACFTESTPILLALQMYLWKCWGAVIQDFQSDCAHKIISKYL